MTDGSQPLDNPKHEQFAQAVANGMSGAAAYRHAYPKASAATAETTGPALLRESQVILRVENLKALADSIAEKKVEFGKEQLVEFLVETIQTPVGHIDENHRLAQEYTRESQIRGRGEDKQEWEVQKLKMPGKMDAAKLLATICGWNAPTKVESSVAVTIDPAVRESVRKRLGKTS